MANEGTGNINLSFAKNGANFNFRPRVISFLFNVSGNYAIQQIFTIGTTDTVIDLENVGTPGYLIFHNLDNFSDVTYGDDGAHYPVKTRKGGNGYSGPLEWNGAAIHAISTPSQADVEVLILPQ